MRWLVPLSSALCIACFSATCAGAQAVQWGEAQDQIPPYSTHIDRRHGHDHVYPDRGAIVRNLPQGATVVNYAGISYRFGGGVWYEPRGPAYMVVAPPIGLVVPTLPAFATNVDSHGKTYLYVNEVFYLPRPDLGGYEVVNDPQDSVSGGERAPAGAPMPIPDAARQPSATAETSAGSRALSPGTDPC